MGLKSRTKGASGEREAIKLLLDWWKAYCPSVKFRRGNGGVNGSDIMCDDPTFPFAVECKRKARVLPSDVHRWLKQAEAQTPEGLLPMLLYREDRRPWHVYVGWTDTPEAAVHLPWSVFSNRSPEEYALIGKDFQVEVQRERGA